MTLGADELSALGYVDFQGSVVAEPVGRRKGQRALVPMFGGEGLCRRCGAPTGPQVGPIIYELSPALSPLPAVWSTVEVGLNVLCLRGDIADQVAANFDVAMVDVEWRGRRKGGRAKQLVPHVDSRPWYDPVVMAEYPMISGQIARVCPKFGTIAYLNNAFRPIKLDVIESSTEPLVCSPERFWFGRNTLMRRDMAEFIASVAKDDFDFRDLEVDGVDDGNFSPTPPPIPEGAVVYPYEVRDAPDAFRDMPPLRDRNVFVVASLFDGELLVANDLDELMEYRLKWPHWRKNDFAMGVMSCFSSDGDRYFFDEGWRTWWPNVIVKKSDEPVDAIWVLDTFRTARGHDEFVWGSRVRIQDLADVMMRGTWVRAWRELVEIGRSRDDEYARFFYGPLADPSHYVGMVDSDGMMILADSMAELQDTWLEPDNAGEGCWAIRVVFDSHGTIYAPRIVGDRVEVTPSEERLGEPQLRGLAMESLDLRGTPYHADDSTAALLNLVQAVRRNHDTIYVHRVLGRFHSDNSIVE